MFCVKCGAKLPDGAVFCEMCGARQEQSNTAAQQPQEQPAQQLQKPQVQQSAPTPVRQEPGLTGSQKKKSWPMIVAIVVAAVLVLGAAGALAYRFVIAPSIEEGGLSGKSVTDDAEPAIVGIMEMTSESLRSLKPISGANFELDMSVEDQDISVSGFFDLGSDMARSVGYARIYAMGESIEAAFKDGRLLYDNDGISGSMELSELNAALGLDLNGIVKNGTLNTETIAELVGDTYGSVGRRGRAFSENTWKEVDKAWRKHLLDNRDALDMAFTVKSQTDEKIEYQIHTEEFCELLSGCLENLVHNGSAATAEMAEDLLDILEDAEDEIEDISDITVILELDDEKLESMKVKFSGDDNNVVFSLEVDEQYLGEIELDISGDDDGSFSLKLKNHNNPAVNNSKLNSLEERANFVNAEPIGIDAPYNAAEPAAGGNETYDTAADDDYLFPSDTQYITEAYLSTLTRDEVALIRNEIYARHGYVFKTDKYRQYFSGKSCYTPNTNYDGTSLSAIEAANRDTIVAYEAKMGWK